MSIPTESALAPLQAALRQSLNDAAAGVRRRRPRVAVEIGRYGVRAAALDRSGRRIEAFFAAEITPATHADARARAHALGTRLRGFLRARRAADFTAVLSTGNLRSLIADLPPLPPAECADALALKAARLIGTSAEGWSAAAALLGDRPPSEARSFLLAVVPRDDLEEMLEVCRIARVMPSRVTLAPLLYPHLMPAAPAMEDEAQSEASVWVVTDIRRESTSVYIYCNGVLEYSRHIQFGSALLTTALMDVVATPSGFVELVPDEAEALKRTIGFPRSGDQAPPESRLTCEQIRMMLEPKLKGLVFELRNSIRHYQQKSGHHRIHRLVFTGGGSRLRGLDDYVQENLRIPPCRFAPADGGLDVGALDAADAASLTTSGSAVCAALIDSSAGMNLLPSPMRWYRTLRMPCRTAAVAALAATLTMAGLGLNMRTTVADYERFDAALAETTKYAQAVSALQAEIATLDARLADLTADLSLSVPLAELLADLSRRTPPDAKLTHISVINELARQRVTLQGKTTSPAGDTEQAVALIEAYAESPFNKEVRIKSLSRQGVERDNRFLFTLDVIPYVRETEVRR